MRLKRGNFTQNQDLHHQTYDFDNREREDEEIGEQRQHDPRFFGSIQQEEKSFYSQYDDNQQQQQFRNQQQNRKQSSSGVQSKNQSKSKSHQASKKSGYSQPSVPQQQPYYDRNERDQIDNMEISTRSKALLLQQRAILEDNMKDLAYMELISGNQGLQEEQFQEEEEEEDYSHDRYTPKNSSGNQYQRNDQNRQFRSPDYQYGREPSPYSQQREPLSSQGRSQYSHPKHDPTSYRDKLIKDDNSQFQQRQEYFQQRAQQEEYELGPGLTPGASRHYEGVKNLYQQEIDILKYNIWQCQQQDKRIQPEYEAKEEKLWQSFSQSPSPNRNNIDDLEERPEEEEEDMDQDDKEIKRVKVAKPKNALRDEVYLNMTERAINQGSHSGRKIKPYQQEERLTTQENETWQKQQIGQGTWGMQSPIAQSKPRNGQEYSEEEIEQLRRENEALRQNLQRQKQGGVSTQQQQKTIYYQQQQQQQQQQREPTQMTQHSKKNPSSYQQNQTNPYHNNLFNSAMKDDRYDPQPTSYFEADQISPAPVVFSPITNKNQGDKRDKTYEDLINADEEEFVAMKRQEQEREMQENQNKMSPYAKLGYYDRMMLIRKNRQEEEEEMQKVEKERRKHQRNVLRKKKSTMTCHKSFYNQTYMSKYNTPHKKHQHESGVQQVVDDNVSVASSYKQGGGNYSRAGKSEVTAFLLCTKVDFSAPDKYLRKVSKYDLDRQNVDFDRLRREKERERTDGNKQAKVALDKELEAKQKGEVEAKEAKIQELQTIKERQEKERKEQIKKNQEAFRRAIEERRTLEQNQQYLSPTPAKKKTQSKSNVKSDWAGEQRVEGTPRAKDQNQLPQQESAPRLSNSQLR